MFARGSLRLSTLAAAALLCAWATACGGGGSGGGSVPIAQTPNGGATPPSGATPTTAPTATAAPSPTPTPASSTVPALAIVAVVPNISSVKVRVSPVPGALDYRIYNVAKPTSMKYAGMLQTYDGYSSHTGSSVNTELEANGLAPGATAQYVVEAVDALGPTGAAEPTLQSTYNSAAGPSGNFALGAVPMPMPAPGSNEQPTSDGNTSTNGQGAASNHPHVIARSLPFTIATLTAPALPTTGGSQTFFDTFPDSEGASIVRTSVDSSAHGGGVNGAYAHGAETFAMGNWLLRYANADILNSYPFVMHHHFMDVLFDGSVPGSGGPPGEAWSWMSLTPNAAANFSNAILHATMEVDCEQHGRRFASFGIEPHGYPIVDYSGVDFGEPANLNVDNVGNPVNLGVDVQFGPGAVGMTQAVGGTHTDGSTPPDGKIFPNTRQIVGNPGGNNPLVSYPLSQQAHGLDDRCREDVFIADTKPTTEFALYQDGKSVISNGAPTSVLTPLAIPLPWASSVDVNFYHVIYHTNLEHQEIAQYTPWESFWHDTVQDSDERHWNNMGFEVLPMSEITNLASHAQPAPPQAPIYVTAARRKTI